MDRTHVLFLLHLQKSLPLLRHSLSLNKMHIDGVRPPPPTLNVLPPAPLPSSVGGTPALTPLSSGTVPMLAQQVSGSSVAMHPMVGGVAVPVMRPAATTVGPLVQPTVTIGVRMNYFENLKVH
jgi:hypothetical protein